MSIVVAVGTPGPGPGSPGAAARVDSAKSPSGIYVVAKYDADIDEWYADVQYARQAHALPLAGLIDLTSGSDVEAALYERMAHSARGRAALEALGARFLAAQAFHAKHRPFDTIVTRPNKVTTRGGTYLWTCLSGSGVTPTGGPPPTANANNYLTSTTAGLGFGDGNASVPTPALSDNDLTATTNVFYILVNAAPTIGTNQVTLTASLGGTQANYAINEVVAGNFISATNTSTQTTKLSGTAYSLISHIGQALGTKSSGQTWTATFTDAFA